MGHTVELPPLRERREDIGTIIAAVLSSDEHQSRPITVHKLFARALFHYSFPLNIRELEQALRRAVALADGQELKREHLPEAIRSYRPGAMLPEDQARRERLSELLRSHRGNVAAVARVLGKAPTQVRRWCARFSLQISSYRN